MCPIDATEQGPIKKGESPELGPELHIGRQGGGDVDYRGPRPEDKAAAIFARPVGPSEQTALSYGHDPTEPELEPFLSQARRE